MKPRTTLILFLLTAGLAAWMLLREDHVKPDGHLLFDFSARTLAAGTPTVDIDGAQVAGIDLKSTTASLSLRRGADGRWELTAPLKDRADEATVKQLVEFTSLARIREILDKGELDSGKVTAPGLGLDDANAWQVTWLDPAGKALTSVRVGKTAPPKDTAYIQVPGRKERPDIYLVEPDLRLLLARPADAFRDPRVARYTSEEVLRLAVRKGEGEVEFSRASAKPSDNKPWVISRPLSNAPANQAAVKDFVAMICGAKLEGWVPWTEAPAGDKPVVEVTLFPAGEGARGSTLSFYEDTAPDKKFAICRDPQRKASFKVAREIMEDICFAESPGNFRDIKLASVEPGFISTIRVEHKEGESVEIVRVGNKWSWRKIGGKDWSDAAPEAVDKLFRLVNETEVTNFESDSLADPAAYALADPAIRLTFAKGAHVGLETLTEVTAENSRVLRIGIRDDGHIFANFAGEPFVFRIGPELPGAIPRAALKWRTLLLTSFSLTQLKSMKQFIGSAPPVELSYNSLSFMWSASRSGADVTEKLQKEPAELIAAKLGALSAASWLGDSAEARKALSTPAVRMEATFEEYTLRASKNELRTIIIELSPMGPTAPFCYGRLAGTEEYFLLDAATLKEFTRPLLGK